MNQINGINPLINGQNNSASGSIVVDTVPCLLTLFAYVTGQTGQTSQGTININSIGTYSTAVATVGSGGESVQITIPTIGTYSFTMSAVFGGNGGNGVNLIDNTNYTPPVNNFEITNTAFESSQSASCTNVIAEITTSELATKILSPVVVSNNSDNPFAIEVLRGVPFILTIENANGDQITQTIVPPGLLNANNFSLDIINSPFGATVTVNNQNGISGFTVQYAIDNGLFQDSNIFSGVAVGDHQLAVVDNLGCRFFKDFTIEESGIQNPYFYISKSNSIRFANRITWGDSENYKNDENTLSCEVDTQIAYKEIQQFQSADVITTQFKSNYKMHSALWILEDITNGAIPIVQKTNNIGIKDKRDAFMYDLGSGKTGIYFISGNVYDYNTNAVTGTYSLNGLTPEWVTAGNYVSIGNTFYLIEDVVFNENINADVLVINNTYSGVTVPTIVGCIYNRFNYEVYEFTIDFVNFIDKKFRIRLVCQNTNQKPLIHLSELLWCKVKHEGVLEIKYYNTTNTDVFYATGIIHKIRQPYISIAGKTDDTSENHKTDTDAILLNSELYECDDFRFEPVTKELMRKLTYALSHEVVFINGVRYVRNGQFNIEGPLDRSNLYVVTAPMIKAGSVYNSQSSSGMEFTGSEVAIPGLISTEVGFLKY